MFERFGVAFWNDLSCQELRRFGQRADELGFDSVWLAESYQWVRRASELVAEGASQAGRDPAAVDVAAYLVMSVDPDPARARAACKPLIASYAPRPVQWRDAGLVSAEDIEPVLSAFGQGGLEAATAAVSDALVDKLAIAGDPAYCRDRLREYARVGLRLPIAYQVLGPDPFLGMELIAREFLPRRAQSSGSASGKTRRR